MSKRLVHMLEELVDSMFLDMKFYYTKVSDWDRDRSRSLHELAINGERFLTIDLPAIRKHFDKCLGELLYTRPNLPYGSSVSATVVVPAYLRNLYLQVFSADGKLRYDASPEAVACIRQLLDTFGKLKVTCKEKYIAKESKEFSAIEQGLRQPTLRWESDQLADQDSRHRSVSLSDGIPVGGRNGSLFPVDQVDLTWDDAVAVQAICDRIFASFGDLHNEDPEEIPKHGPGAVSDMRRGQSKYLFPHATEKLTRVFPYDRYFNPTLGVSSDGLIDLRWTSKEAPSKLIAVPKTATGPRLIASEPVAHQWAQQLIRNQLERRVKRSLLRNSISFGDQEPNRVLAQQSSIDGTSATVDLKSASDRLSCWTIERVLRSNISMLERIHACRTRWMVNTLDTRRREFYLLKKCFTQGSACTFPVQTLVYAALCISGVILSRKMPVTTRNIIKASTQVRVFGDDLIIPSDCLGSVTAILQFNQLKINPTKTFHKGPFRESCGLDAFNGVDVTPQRIRSLAVKPSHETVQSLLQVSNNLYRAGMWNLAFKLDSLFLRRWKFPVVHVRGSEAASVNNAMICASGAKMQHLKKRYCKYTHQELIQIDFLTSKSKKVPTQTADDLCEFLFASANRKISNPLRPLQGGLGVVNKTSSVMRRGWVPSRLFS